jgi:hypothetical protein
LFSLCQAIKWLSQGVTQRNSDVVKVSIVGYSLVESVQTQSKLLCYLSKPNEESHGVSHDLKPFTSTSSSLPVHEQVPSPFLTKWVSQGSRQ